MGNPAPKTFTPNASPNDYWIEPAHSPPSVSILPTFTLYAIFNSYSVSILIMWSGGKLALTYDWVNLFSCGMYMLMLNNNLYLMVGVKPHAEF